MYSIKVLNRDGHDVYYIEKPSKEVTAPITLLLHGFPGDAYDWTHQFGVLENYYVVAPFMPGVKEGEKVELRRLEIETVVEDIVAILSEIDPEYRRPLYFIGHDLGCFFTTALAEKYGDRVNGLVNINGLGLQQYYLRLSRLNTWIKSYYVLFLQFGLIRHLVSDTFVTFFLKTAFSMSGLEKEDPKFQSKKNVMANILIYRMLFKRVFSYIGKSIQKSSIPTLFIWGNHDAFLEVPRKSEVNRFYSKAVIRVVQGGHWVNRSEKVHVNRLLLRTLTEWEQNSFKGVSNVKF